MASFLGSGRINDSGGAPATALRIQSSINGQPLPIVHGQQRVAGNFLWTDGFSNSGGGKGGKGGSGMPSYSANIAIGICEGPAVFIPTAWRDQGIWFLSQVEGDGGGAFEFFNGTQGQAPWPYLTATLPAQAIGYSWLAYLASAPFEFGRSPAMPNLTFEVRGAISGAVTETYDFIAPYTFTPQYFTLANAVTEQVVIPPGTYQVQAQNWQAATSLLVVQQLIPANGIIGSGSSGVVDINGRVFTPLVSLPSPLGSNATGTYFADPTTGLYSFSAADVGLQVTIVDLALSPGVHYAYKRTAEIAKNSLLVAGIDVTNLAMGQPVFGTGIATGTVVAAVDADTIEGDAYTGSGTVTLSQLPTLNRSAANLTFVGGALVQVLNSSLAVGRFSVSVEPGTYGQYQFDSGEVPGTSFFIYDVPDASPADSLTDFLTNPRYGAGIPTANIGDLSQLTNFAYANGLFISPALVSSQAANAFLKDFSTGLNGEFVWSCGLLSFVPYGDAAISGFGKNYAPPSAPIYSLTDDDFMKNQGASAGVASVMSVDPVIGTVKPAYNFYNDVKVEYLDRGNSYNPAIVEAQDDAAISDFGLRPADTRSLHFFCMEGAALASAQLQLGRQRARNLYTFTLPWYFGLLDPMDIVAITDAALGLDQQWVRILRIVENQQDMSLTFTAEEYIPGTGQVGNLATQARLGFVPNAASAPASVN